MKILYGEKRLDPIEYKITNKVSERKWWKFGNYVEYYIESDYCKLGPFSSYNDAFKMLHLIQSSVSQNVQK